MTEPDLKSKIPNMKKKPITFAAYLKAHGMRPRHFSTKHGLVHSTVWRAATGRRITPSSANDIILALIKDEGKDAGNVSFMSMVLPSQYPDEKGKK